MQDEQRRLLAPRCMRQHARVRACACLPGWAGDGVTCNDDGPCLAGNGGCSPDAACTSSGTSRTCACRPGYTGDGLTCTDVIECLTNNGGCSVNASCVNTPGSRTCICKTGYAGDGVTCTDVNECLTNNGGCAAGARCTNTAGSRNCQCPAGFTGNGVTCTDVNECATNYGGCATTADCINLSGSFRCACKANYAGDGKKCLPVKDGYTVEERTIVATECDDLSGSTENLANDTSFTYEGGTVVRTLPFAFTFFGRVHDKFTVSTSGLLRLVDSSVQAPHPYGWFSQTIPSPTYPNSLLAPFWSNGAHAVMLSGTDTPQYVSVLRTSTFGNAPNRRFTVEWFNWGHSASGFGNTRLTFQVKLFEGSNRSEFHYCSMAPAPGDETWVRGADASIGIEGPEGRQGYQYSYQSTDAVAVTKVLGFEVRKEQGACNPGWANCDGNPSTGVGGCEVNLQADVNHCGACGASACAAPPVGTPRTSAAACVFGACTYACDAGFLDCNGGGADGCEVNGRTDITNCGMCTNRCSDGWSGQCQTGKCN